MYGTGPQQVFALDGRTDLLDYMRNESRFFGIDLGDSSRELQEQLNGFSGCYGFAEIHSQSCGQVVQIELQWEVTGSFDLSHFDPWLVRSSLFLVWSGLDGGWGNCQLGSVI